MNEILRVIVCVLLWLELALTVSADPAPVRVAVISTPETANLAALVTTELSKSPGISIVERDGI